MSLLRATTLFWIMVGAGLLPFFLRIPTRIERPSRAFAAWNRSIILIRAAEFATIFLYLAADYLWHWSFPLTQHLVPAAAGGLVITLAGVALASWSRIELGQYFSTTLGVKKEHQLITTGPYRWIRHPIYTGLLLLLLGAALVHNSGSTLLMLFVPFCIFFYWQSVLEERLLENHLGDAYRRYRDRTGRLLPRILR